MKWVNTVSFAVKEVISGIFLSAFKASKWSFNCFKSTDIACCFASNDAFLDFI
jgi:hypothetical protein